MKVSLIISVSFHHTYWTTINCDYRSEVELEATFSIFFSPLTLFSLPQQQQQRNFIGWNAISSERSGANSIDSQYKYCKKRRRTNDDDDVEILKLDRVKSASFLVSPWRMMIVVSSFCHSRSTNELALVIQHFGVDGMTTLSSLKCIVWMLQQLVSFTKRGKKKLCNEKLCHAG